jgi:hypothetical protein
MQLEGSFGGSNSQGKWKMEPRNILFILGWLLLCSYGLTQLYSAFVERPINIFELIRCPMTADENQMKTHLQEYTERISKAASSVNLKEVRAVKTLGQFLMPLHNRRIFSRFTLEALQCSYCIQWSDYFVFSLPTVLLIPYLKTMTVLGLGTHLLFNSKNASMIRIYLLIIMIMAIIIESFALLNPKGQMNLKLWSIVSLERYFIQGSKMIQNQTFIVQITFLRKMFFTIIASSLLLLSYIKSITQQKTKLKIEERKSNILGMIKEQEELKELIRVIYLQQYAISKNDLLKHKWIKVCSDLDEDWQQWLSSQPELAKMISQIDEIDKISPKSNGSHETNHTSIREYVKNDLDRVLKLALD